MSRSSWWETPRIAPRQRAVDSALKLLELAKYLYTANAGSQEESIRAGTKATTNLPGCFQAPGERVVQMTCYRHGTSHVDPRESFSPPRYPSAWVELYQTVEEGRQSKMMRVQRTPVVTCQIVRSLVLRHFLFFAFEALVLQERSLCPYDYICRRMVSRWQSLARQAERAGCIAGRVCECCKAHGSWTTR